MSPSGSPRWSTAPAPEAAGEPGRPPGRSRPPARCSPSPAAPQAEYAANRAGICERLAFYGSTPAYRAVLEHHGWGDLHEDLHQLSLQGRWKEMGGLIDDDVLGAFAVVAHDPATAGRLLRERYTGVYTRVSLALAAETDLELALAVLEGVRG
ncbi:hypothetical protein ACU686_42775 [Yinghuangia aomiensis]